MRRVLPVILLCVGMLNFLPTLKAQFVEEKAIDSTNNAEIEEQKMIIQIIDADTRAKVEADVIVKGLNPRKPVTLPHVTDTTVVIKNYRLYTVSVVKEGYMYYAHRFWPDETLEHRETIQLQPLDLGLKTSVEDIIFLGDQTEIYHKSMPALQELTNFLKLNPEVKLMIIGHANGPETEEGQDRRQRGPSYYKKASEKRAIAVRDYLIQQGIAPERLATKGAGNAEMVYPDPKTDWETQTNRRVEIEIIGL